MIYDVSKYLVQGRDNHKTAKYFEICLMHHTSIKVKIKMKF